jgi:ribosomal protein S18 acetylase RimI-like enzyme
MTISKIFVRTASSGDVIDIAELGARTFLTSFAADNRPEDVETYVADSFNRETIAREIADPNSVFFLVVLDDIIIGYTKLRKGITLECVDGPNPIELERIYVDADHQGIGAGKMLMRAATDYAREEGYQAIWLGVWEKNAGARRFYERAGFVLVGSKYFMVGNDRQNDVVMSRILD